MYGLLNIIPMKEMAKGMEGARKSNQARETMKNVKSMAWMSLIPGKLLFWATTAPLLTRILLCTVLGTKNNP